MSMSFTLPDPGPVNSEFEVPADRERMQRTVAALQSRGFKAEIADSADQARQMVLDAIPDGAEVHSALSETMQQIGITAEIDESGRYSSVRAALQQFDRETQGREMRKLGAAPDYIVGSAAAITDDGQVVVASGSGSQLGAYAYAGGNVILVVGHQKLVRDVEEGLRRVREYSLPREFARMQSVGHPGTLLAKTLIIHQEPAGRIRVILVPETLGF
jgi:L-lactate utilization protein LutC